MVFLRWNELPYSIRMSPKKRYEYICTEIESELEKLTPPASNGGGDNGGEQTPTEPNPDGGNSGDNG